MFSNGILNGGGFGNAGVINIKTVNNQSLLGSGNINIASGEIVINALQEKITPTDTDLLLIEDSESAFSKKKVLWQNLPAGGSSVLKNLEGEARYEYVPYIDIPLELDNYESQTLKTTNLLNDTSAVRLRYQFLDNEGNPITSTGYFWGNGYITNSQNQSATEYGNNSAFGSLAGERLQSGLSNDIAGNVTKLDIEIKKYGNGTYNLLSKFQYLDTNLYSTGSFIENTYRNNQSISGIRIFPSSGNIKGIFYKYALQKSSVAQQTQSVVAPLQTSSILEASVVQKVIDIPKYPI